MPPRGWAALADRRATELLASAYQGGTAVVVRDAGGFPAPAVAGEPVEPGSLDGTRTFDVVLDASRPEEPRDQGRRLAELARACRHDGTIAAIACGGPPGCEGTDGPCSLALLCGLLSAAAWHPVQVVPFDVLGPLSPWRLGLGGRADRVLAELDALLRFRSVRAAARLLERALVPTLPHDMVGRVLVVARRGAEGGPPPPPDVVTRLADPDLALRVVSLLQHDAVVRFAAFVDAEVLPALGLRFGFVRYLVAVAGQACIAEPVRRQALARRRAWFPGLDARRLVEALSHRMARRTAACLAEGGGDSEVIAGSFDYVLLETCNAVLDAHLDDPWTAPSAS